MRPEELDRTRTTLARLIAQTHRDAEDLRRRVGAATTVTRRLEGLVETARRIDAILRDIRPSQSANGSRHDSDEPSLGDARGAG